MKFVLRSPPAGKDVPISPKQTAGCRWSLQRFAGQRLRMPEDMRGTSCRTGRRRHRVRTESGSSRGSVAADGRPRAGERFLAVPLNSVDGLAEMGLMDEAVPLPARAVCRRLILEALTELGGRATRRDVTDRALQLGGFSDDQLAVPPPPSHPQYANQIEYRLSWAMTDLKRIGEVVNPERGIWALPSAAPTERVAETKPAFGASVTQARLEELRAMPYREYLRTPEWSYQRHAALARAGHCCQLDRRHRTDLEVHHNSYERRGNEQPSDLVVLCNACHSKHHNKPARVAGASSIAGQHQPPPLADVTLPQVARKEKATGVRRRVRWQAAAGLAGTLIVAGVVTAAATPEPPSKPDNAHDCRDLTYAEAQRILKADPTDPNHLDANGDGEACDSKRS